MSQTSPPSPSPTNAPSHDDLQRQEFPLLRPFQNAELVIGLVAPLGATLESVRRILRARLETAGYLVFEVRVSQDVIPSVSKVPPFEDGDFEARVTSLMDAGNDARLRSGDNGIVALGTAKVIGGYRQWCLDQHGDAQPKRAYIVSSLKHPEEVETLRLIYPEGFYMIGVHENQGRRLRWLVNEKRVNENKAKALMARDEDEHKKHGQRVTDTFHLADFFVRMDGSDDQLRHALWRIVDLMFGHPYLTPTFDEYAMFMAFAASLRSADLSRQVGAVIAINNQVLSTGANDCPRFGGGLYWPEVNKTTGEVEDVAHGRDFMRECDSNAVARREIMDDVIAEAAKLTEDAAKLDKFKETVQRGRIHDLTEYGRVVHAEMEALLSCARASIRTTGGTVYSTTFPCHNCAKHIIAAGIERVVFIEPYPKSKAFTFHNEAIDVGFQGDGPPSPKVWFEPFVGVGPRRFFDLFSISLGSGSPVKRKDGESGTRMNFVLEDAKLRLQMLPNSYLVVESEAARAFEAHTLKKEGSTDVSPPDNADDTNRPPSTEPGSPP